MEAIGRAVKKQHRLACNINQFTRVVVELNEDSAPLEITVDRSSTISYLSQQIEAEHWFCRVLPSLERLDPEKRERILAEMDPISVEQIYTERNLALRFDDSIGKMLSYGERIYVLASGQVTPNNGKSTTLKLVTTAETGTLHSKLLDLLHNRNALLQFAKFCAQSFCLENLLFWVDVECFKSISSGSEFQSDYAEYISDVYIKRGAPLELNLLRDVLDRTTDDLLNSSSSSSIMSSLFDEVQEQVFNILNKHTHQRFIKSRQYRDLLLSRLNGSNEEVYSGAYFSPENMKHEQLLAIYNIIVSFDGEQKSIESRESILTKVADRFSSELVAALPRDYFNDLVRKKWGAVQRGQTRKKSVKKFFNQKVSGLDIEQQLGTMMMDEEDADVENIIASLLDELEGVSQAQIPQEKFEKRLVSKITRLRKLDKLKSALGIGSPRSISTASSDTNLAIKLAAPSASISASNSISDLDKDEKKNFFRQSKKLQHVLGESLTEEAVKQLIGSSRKNLSKLASDSDLRLSASNDLFQQRTSAADMASTDRNEIVSDDDYDSGDDDIEKADIRKKQLNKLKYVLGENIANFSQLPCISKLSSVFGERISMDELESSASSLLKEGGGGQGFTENTPSDLPRPLNAEERRMLQKRLAKIEYLLGRPPREELATQEYLVLHNNSGQNVEPSVIEASEISESYELNTWDHRKRMHDKLFDLLGERVPVNDFGDIGLEAGENDDEIISAPPPRPLTTQEKKRLQKRLNKLEQLQGKIPNSADLANQHSSPSSSHSFKKQLESPPASPEIRQQPLTMEEKRSIQKRSNKIEQMLGAVPPASMLKPSKSKADEDLSIISVISAAESSDYDVDVKEIKMKRREKLVNILGEILPKEVFNSTFHLESSEHGAFEIDGSQGKGELHEAVALSPDEKRALQKRLYKIEQLLGHKPPIELIMTQVVEVLMEDDDSLLDESSISVQSLVELKGIKRRRVDKLMELLGERPPHELVMVDENLPLTPVQRPLSNDEKKTLQKRVNKIGQMLGEQLPSEVLAAQAQEIRKSTDNLSVLRDRADSSTSIATNASNSYNEAFQSKVVKKKRIDKLIELLGERPPNDLVGLANISDWEIPSSPLITTRPLTIEERKILRTRLNKLEQMLGEQPPSAVVVAQLSEIRKSGENLSSGLSRDRASSDASLISFDYESKDVKRKRFDKLVELLGERPPQDLVARVISEDTSPPISTTLDKPLSLEEKKALRKRINKLGQMLGSTLPSDMMNNQRRLADNVVVKRTMVVERSISESSLASLDNRATSPATKEANHGQIIEEKKQRKYKGKIVGPYDVQERRVKSTPTSPVVSRRSSVSRQDIEQVPIILNQGDDRHHYDNKPRLVPTLILETESGGNLTRSTDSNLSTILSTTSSVIPEKVVMRNQLDKLKSILGERPPQPLLSQPGPRSKAKSKRPKKEATTASARRPFEHESNPPCLQEPENSRPAALVLIEDSNKLSTQEKVSVQRRRSKMEQVFGETPPTHILQHPLTASSGVSSANDQLDNDEASYSDDEVVQVSQKRISQKRHSKLEQMLGEVPSLEEVAHVMNTTSSSEVGVAIEREEEEVAKKQKRLSQRRPSKLGQLFAGMDLIESPKNSGVSAVESNLNEFVDQGNQKSGGQSQMSKRGEATTGNDETNTQESASSTTVATPEESLMLNPQDKRQLQKRRSKLGQMFGEEVHQNALTTNYIARNDHHIDGGVGDDEPIDKDAANIDANNNLHSETKEVRRRQRNKVSEVLGEKPPSVLLLEPAAAGTETDEAGNNTKTTNRLSKIFNIVFFGGISASATTPSVSDSSRIIVVADAVSSEVKVALNASDTGLQRANSSIYSENTPMEDVENFKLSNISKKIDAMLAASDHRSMKSSSSSSSSSKKKSELLQRPTRINSVTESELALPVSHEDSSSSEVDGFEDEDSEEDKARRSVKRVESLNELEFDENDSKRLFIWRK